MKVIIIGGGTAGYMAVAHLTRHFPQADLLHVFDSRIPRIGVGEGTTPRFPDWFKEVTGLGFATLAQRCHATLKHGTRFEGWGRAGRNFLNRFQPVRLYGYHFDASDVVEVLGEHGKAKRMDARVTRIVREGEGAVVVFENGERHECDYVFDARGFPGSGKGDEPAECDLVTLDWVPTRAAMVRRAAPTSLEGATRAIARSHGWIFHIPLAHATSCGYIFDPDISSEAEVDTDFDAFLAGERICSSEKRATLRFPNFVRRDVFDGAVFRIGNAASFTEPLEATAICTVIVQLRAATRWMQAPPQVRAAPRALAGFNRSLTTYVCKNSLFVAWHYACGSRYDTPFWQRARGWLGRVRRSKAARSYLPELETFIEAGRDLPGLSLPLLEDQEQWDREVPGLLRVYLPFGNFSELNFSQVGHGIGYYGSGQLSGRSLSSQPNRAGAAESRREPS